MAYARRNDSFGRGFKGGNKKFGGAPRGRGFSSDRGGARSMLFPATCGNCGNHCEVPFRPNGKKPVLCKNCFSRDNDFEPKFNKRQESGRPVSHDDTSSQLRIINGKLDTILKAIESGEFSL